MSAKAAYCRMYILQYAVKFFLAAVYVLVTMNVQSVDYTKAKALRIYGTWLK